jgi:Tfp pilus assembly protein PilN
MTVVDSRAADSRVVDSKTVDEKPVEAASPSAPPKTFMAGLENWKNLLVIGTSVGVEIAGGDLQMAIVRGRPNGATVVAKLFIPNFRDRTPLDWGREFQDFLQQHGQKHLSATVLLPRREVIVRLASMPGVSRKDIPGALAFQIDSMHPYGDEAVSFAWSRADVNTVLVGIIRKDVLDEYIALFQAAGIPVSGFTFSASAIYSALRLYGAPPRNFLVMHAEADGEGVVEIYGESDSRPVFSAEFDLPPARAAGLARAELRLSNAAAGTLDSILPLPVNVVTVSPAVYATGLAALARLQAPFANLLPIENRTVHSRARLIPTLLLGLALISVAAAWFAYWQFRDEWYLAKLESQIAQIQQTAMRADAIDRRTADHRNRVLLLDDYRKRAQNDIEIMAELSRILPPTAWASAVEITQDTVVIAGEAEQAAPLLKLIDASPLFRNSEFSMGFSHIQNGEGFRIRTFRRVRK